jgi:hypothetical protein
MSVESLSSIFELLSVSRDTPSSELAAILSATVQSEPKVLARVMPKLVEQVFI